VRTGIKKKKNVVDLEEKAEQQTVSKKKKKGARISSKMGAASRYKTTKEEGNK